MKITCLREDLLAGLSIAGRAVSRSAYNPVLKHVLFSTGDDGRLTVMGTDLSLTITCQVANANVSGGGGICLPAGLLLDLVKRLPAGQIVLSLDEKAEKVTIHAGCHEANVRGLAAKEMPGQGTFQMVGATRLKLEPALLEQVGRVVYAAAPEEIRPVLSGVFLKVARDNLVSAAADGFRLAVQSVNGQALLEEEQPPVSLILPARALKEITALCARQEEPVELVIPPEPDRVLFRLDGVEVETSVVGGAYPNYTQIIPSRWTSRAVVDRKTFLKDVRRAYLFARDAADMIVLKVGGGLVSVTSTSVEFGDHAGEIDATLEGDEDEVALNGRYLMQALSAMTGDKVALERVAQPGQPFVLRPADQDDGHESLAVIMPMQDVEGVE